MAKSLKEGIEDLLYGITSENKKTIEEMENVAAYQHIDAEAELTQFLLKNNKEIITLKTVSAKINDLIGEVQMLNSEQLALLQVITGEEQNKELEPIVLEEVDGVLPKIYALCYHLQKHIDVTKKNMKKFENILG